MAQYPILYTTRMDLNVDRDGCCLMAMHFLSVAPITRHITNLQGLPLRAHGLWVLTCQTIWNADAPGAMLVNGKSCLLAPLSPPSRMNSIHQPHFTNLIIQTILILLYLRRLPASTVRVRCVRLPFQADISSLDETAELPVGARDARSRCLC